ncbi:MAG: carbamate kinase [Bacteroidetes bacterium]|nr:MAG: carbamate kinase [Bacteroidota bacterium]
MAKTAVIALGGNALLRSGQKGTVEEQVVNTMATLENIVFLIKEGFNIVLSHGNGPQVGNLLMQQTAGNDEFELPAMPLDVCVAQTQGSIGYMIEQCLRNVLAKHHIQKDITTLISPVQVDPNDPAFQNPTKRVGRTYSKEEADALAKENGWQFKEETKKGKTGWRRVVPSPRPIDVLNAPMVKRLSDAGVIVVAVGGGGVPVSIGEKGEMTPIEAVIDKDSASSVLASRIGAERFYILTDVPYVYINYGQPNEEKLDRVPREDVKRYLAEGMFGEGNMAPKIRASLDFLDRGGEVAVITEATKLEDTVYGTRIM